MEKYKIPNIIPSVEFSFEQQKESKKSKFLNDL